MAKEYQVSGSVRFVNRIIMLLLRLGIPMQNFTILTVPGRKSGKTYSVPVNIVVENGQRWIVSPYGEVNWVKNARAAGAIKLTRGKTETVRLHEVDVQNGAPILKKYIQLNPITQPYFNTPPDASLDQFVGEVQNHPVFLVE